MRRRQLSRLVSPARFQALQLRSQQRPLRVRLTQQRRQAAVLRRQRDHLQNEFTVCVVKISWVQMDSKEGIGQELALRRQYCQLRGGITGSGIDVAFCAVSDVPCTTTRLCSGHRSAMVSGNVVEEWRFETLQLRRPQRRLPVRCVGR